MQNITKNFLTLIPKKPLLPRVPIVLNQPTVEQVKAELETDKEIVYGIDIETTGVDVSNRSQRVVGIGIAGPTKTIYVDVDNGTDPLVYACVLEWLKSHKLTAFNVQFDGVWLLRDSGVWLNWLMCSYGMFKQLATESFPGQQWNLKTAQLDILGWEESNKDELGDWLRSNGLSKDKMYKAPIELLGKYCALDAEAALGLFKVFSSVVSNNWDGWGRALTAYHREEFLTLVKLIAYQQLRGIAIDQDKLLDYQTKLNSKSEILKNEFLTCSEVAPWVKQKYNEKYKTWIEKEPTKFKKNGEVTNAWTKWKAKEDDISNNVPVNINSKQQLEELFYDVLNNKEPEIFDKESESYSVKRTATGRRIIDKKQLPKMGEAGKLLNDYNKLIKQLGYVNTYVSNSKDGILHIGFKNPGTITGRLAGSGGINLQQIPKDKEFLSCLKARPGYKIVQIDFTAIEPVVLAEYSEDKHLLKIYNSDRPNDVYLYTAAHIPGLKEEVLKYYDPNNPTKTGIENAKKNCKPIRNIAKTIVLASNYNAGVRKIYETLVESGHNIDINEVQKIHKHYWDLYKQVVWFKYKLEKEWKDNEGYIINGLCRPLAVYTELTKDLVNRFCQSTGHDLLMIYIRIVDRMITERKLKAYPWIVDFHDETMWEVKEDQAEDMIKLLNDAMKELNRTVNPRVAIKGDPQIADTLADIKCEE